MEQRRQALTALLSKLRQEAVKLQGDLPTQLASTMSGCGDGAFMCEALGQGMPRPAITNLCMWACPSCRRLPPLTRRFGRLPDTLQALRLTTLVTSLITPPHPATRRNLRT